MFYEDNGKEMETTIYRGYTGITGKKMEATIQGFRMFRPRILLFAWCFARKA